MLGGMLGTVTGSFAGGVASADPAHGVVRPGDFAVTQNGTPNMSVNVAAGGAFIRGTQNANQGAYHVWNDGTVNLPISAADVTNGRRDLVIAQVRDSAYSGADDDARITVVTGTPAAVPADPSLASFPNALVLARITVAAGDTAINTADITSLRTLANVENKMPVFSSAVQRNEFIPVPYHGQTVYQTDDSNSYIYNGVKWVEITQTLSPTFYTPVLTATSNPNLGTGGVAYGSYRKLGIRVEGNATVAFGSGAVIAGSGDYFLTVPLNLASGNFAMGSGYVFDSSATAWRHIMLESAGTNKVYLNLGSAARVTHANPWTWSTFDQIQIQFSYQVAA